MEGKNVFRKKGIVKFQGRKHSMHGILSMILGIIVICGLITISFISGMNQGNGNYLVGMIGLMLFVISIAGFIIGIRSFKEKDIFYVAPMIGVGCNGITMVFLFVLYIIGIVV